MGVVSIQRIKTSSESERSEDWILILESGIGKALVPVWYQRFLVALGGGGSRGIDAPEVGVEVGLDAPTTKDPEFAPLGLLRPGMLIEKVWPSFNV